MREQNNQALRWLESDPLLHINMAESLRNGTADLLEVREGGVLLYDRPSHSYMMSASQYAAAEEMLDKIHKPELFLGHQSFYAETVSRKFGLTKKMICHQAVYLSKKPVSLLTDTILIRRLSETDLSFVCRNYAGGDNTEYVRQRLRAGAMYGAYIENIPVGFIGTHAEGSLGLLEVLPEYRRRGIAAALEAFMMNRILDEGKIPFAQIVTGNKASLHLHKKLGFQISEQNMYWLM